MTTPEASTIRAPKTRFVEEISVAISAKELTPTMLSQDFLKFSGVIPQDWELAQQPVLNLNYAQLNYTNGVNITAKPRTLNVTESLNNQATQKMAIDGVIRRYIEKLPYAEYMGYSFCPKVLLPFPNSPQSVRQYITGTLLGSGAWKRIGKAPIQASVNLMYYLERCQLNISVSEAKLQKLQEQPLVAILFSGSFNYNVVQSGNGEWVDRLGQMDAFLENSRGDLDEFREIVNLRFLDSAQADRTQAVSGTSLFPGQTL